MGKLKRVVDVATGQIQEVDLELDVLPQNTGLALADGMGQKGIEWRNAMAEAEKRNGHAWAQPIPTPPIPAHWIRVAPFLPSITMQSLWVPWWRLSRQYLCLAPLYRVPELAHALKPEDCYQHENVAMLIVGQAIHDGYDKEGKDCYRAPDFFDPVQCCEKTKALRADQLEKEMEKAGGSGARIFRLERELESLKRANHADTPSTSS
jgi:hypothetical protein